MNDHLRDLLVKTDAWLGRHPRSAKIRPYFTGIAIWAGVMFTLVPEGTMILLKYAVSPFTAGD